MRFPTKLEWNYRRIFWMVVGLVIGVWIAIVITGWIIRFLSNAGR
ncbi:MAG TPA: hypothetical protein VF074_13180 [Pyrinomonadaceae bacterium]